MGTINKIREGYLNLLIKNNEVEKLAEERYKECDPCDSNSKNKNLFGGLGATIPYCIECGCILKAKVRSLESNCPIGKW